MQIKYIFQGFGVIILASAAWRFVGAEMYQDWRRPPAPRPVAVKFQNDGPTPGGALAEVSSAPRNVPMEVSGARKCRKGNTTVYTDRDCPTGTQEVTIAGGVITVVKGQPAAPKVSNQPATVRDMLVGKDDGALRDKRIEQAINR